MYKDKRTWKDRKAKYKDWYYNRGGKELKEKSYNKWYLTKGKEVRKKYGKIYKRDNRTKIYRTTAKWIKDNLKHYKEWRKLYNKRYGRRNQLKHKYNLTIEEYGKLLRRQKGKCAICKLPLTSPYVDHNHKTKKTRGLLCNKCNRALGLFQDSYRVISNACKYLRRNR